MSMRFLVRDAENNSLGSSTEGVMREPLLLCSLAALAVTVTAQSSVELEPATSPMNETLTDDGFEWLDYTYPTSFNTSITWAWCAYPVSVRLYLESGARLMSGPPRAIVVFSLVYSTIAPWSSRCWPTIICGWSLARWPRH